MKINVEKGLTITHSNMEDGVTYIHANDTPVLPGKTTEELRQFEWGRSSILVAVKDSAKGPTITSIAGMLHKEPCNRYGLQTYEGNKNANTPHLCFSIE